MSTAWTYLLAFLLGAAGAYYVQGLRWDSDVAEIRQNASEDLSAAYKNRDLQIWAAEARKEQVQNEYLAFKDSEAKRNADVAAGVKRVYVRATCPAVSGAASNTGGVESGTAELDSNYRQALSDLRSGAQEQLRLLNVCRAELMAR
jgi:prophage endopeptidase